MLYFDVRVVTEFWGLIRGRERVEYYLVFLLINRGGTLNMEFRVFENGHGDMCLLAM